MQTLGPPLGPPGLPLGGVAVPLGVRIMAVVQRAWESLTRGVCAGEEEDGGAVDWELQPVGWWGRADRGQAGAPGRRAGNQGLSGYGGDQ